MLDRDTANTTSAGAESQPGLARRREASVMQAVECLRRMSDQQLSTFVTAARDITAMETQKQNGAAPTPDPSYSTGGGITLDNIEGVMAYQSWDREQREAGEIVREAITAAAKAVLRAVPNSPRRTLAIQHLVSARMDANAAISFRGRF